MPDNRSPLGSEGPATSGPTAGERADDELHRLRAELAAARAEVDGLRADVAAARAQTRAAQDLMKRIVAHAPIGVGYMDRDLVFRWVNPALAGFLQLEVDQMVDVYVFDFLPQAEPQFGPIMRRVLATGEPFTAEATPFFYEVDGETRRTYWDYTYAPVAGPDGGPDGILVVNVEVSARVRMLELLQEQVERLRELDRVRADFVNAASHELRTPLTTVLGYVEFLAEGIGGPLTPEQARFAGQILAAAKRLRRLVDDILDAALIEAGEFRIVPGDGDLAAVVGEAVEALLPQARTAGVSFELDLPPGTLPARLDAARIGQAVLNLAANAIAVSPAGGRIRLRARAVADGLRVEVADDGPGLAPELHERVFEKFWRGPRAAVRRPGGVGLGLAIAKAMVEAHGGRIGVISAPDAGATFWFELPRDGPPGVPA